MKDKKGFTLIELMIVITLIAILGALAIGIYRHYFRSAFEVDPISVLLAARAAQEEFYADHDRYACRIEDLSGFTDNDTDNRYWINKDKDGRRRFYISVEECIDNGTTGYTIVVKNASEDPKWQIEWRISCNATSTLEGCKPVQVKGSSLFRRLF